MSDNASDFLNMDDETFLKTNPDPSVDSVVEETPATPATTETPEVEETTETSATETSETPAEGVETPEETETEEQKAQRLRDEQGRFKAAEKEPTGKTTTEPEKKDEKKPTAETQTQVPVVNFEDGYKKIMAPFKANGRTIELKTPEEAIQLMQMGANYTRKMQEMAPHRKMLTMLQNNGLLDEGKLSYLIDLDKKNPEAIKKLVKEAGIDPMEIDTSVEPAYQEGNHRVSDEEVAFHTTLEDMTSTPERKETLRLINDGWDKASKEALWNNPTIMTTMHQHRENGIYDRIATEIARRRTLGDIPAHIPFLQAYNVVGNELQKANAFADLSAAPTAETPTAPVVTRVQAPKPKVTNNERAAAASPTRSAPTSAKKPTPNYLQMSDDDFLKSMEGRV